MILHLLSDPKFDPLIIRQFEECSPGDNLFLLFYPRKTLCANKNYPGGITLFAEDFTNSLFRGIDGVICHYLSNQKAEFLRGTPGMIPVAWSIWGGDLYNFLPECRKKIYSRLTIRYLNGTRKMPWPYYLLRDKLRFPLSGVYRNWRYVAGRAGIFSTIIPYEEDLVRKYFKPGTRFLPFPPFSLEKVVNICDYERSICRKETSNRKLYIGNSGHPSNNHLEILHYVSGLEDVDFDVHLPLTYGVKSYIRNICEEGKSLFGNRFSPLLNHLNNTDYLDYISRFNIFIFNSYRQQGIGTIVLALWSGGKVFLSDRNVTSSYFKYNGIKIFSVESDLLRSEDRYFFNPLTREEILLNRKGLLKLYSNEVVNNSIKAFTNSLRS